jgi:four helix bundle protein
MAPEMRQSGVMTATTSFRQLDVWQEAMILVEEVYLVSRQFPPTERFGLTAQLRRATVSVPSNIGEGARRKRRKAFLLHLDIALGSQAEVDVQLEIAQRLGFCSGPDYDRLRQRVDRIGRMLNGLINALQQNEDRDDLPALDVDE